MQNQTFGNWIMARSRSEQLPGIMVLKLDTRNMSHVSDATGKVVPREFPITNLYLAYFNNKAVRSFNKSFSSSNQYIQTTSNYQVTVNGQPITTVQDMKNQLTGDVKATGAMFSLKVTVKGLIKPSTSVYTIVIGKKCASPNVCAIIPDPGKAFLSASDRVVYSLWSVQQPLTINGDFIPSHAWCPVQSAMNLA